MCIPVPLKLAFVMTRVRTLPCPPQPVLTVHGYILVPAYKPNRSFVLDLRTPTLIRKTCVDVCLHHISITADGCEHTGQTIPASSPSGPTSSAPCRASQGASSLVCSLNRPCLALRRRVMYPTARPIEVGVVFVYARTVKDSVEDECEAAVGAQ